MGFTPWKLPGISGPFQTKALLQILCTALVFLSIHTRNTHSFTDANFARSHFCRRREKQQEMTTSLKPPGLSLLTQLPYGSISKEAEISAWAHPASVITQSRLDWLCMYNKLTHLHPRAGLSTAFPLTSDPCQPRREPSISCTKCTLIKRRCPWKSGHLTALHKTHRKYTGALFSSSWW